METAVLFNPNTEYSWTDISRVSFKSFANRLRQEGLRILDSSSRENGLPKSFIVISEKNAEDSIKIVMEEWNHHSLPGLKVQCNFETYV